MNDLFQRFTDDEENDPYVSSSLRGQLAGQTVVLVLHRYCATRGLLFSHLGWIFFKPKYPKLHLIERNDLEEDPGLSTR